jgi:hypothetical protein
MIEFLTVLGTCLGLRILGVGRKDDRPLSELDTVESIVAIITTLVIIALCTVAIIAALQN